MAEAFTAIVVALMTVVAAGVVWILYGGLRLWKRIRREFSAVTRWLRCKP